MKPNRLFWRRILFGLHSCIFLSLAATMTTQATIAMFNDSEMSNWKNGTMSWQNGFLMTVPFLLLAIPGLYIALKPPRSKR